MLAHEVGTCFSCEKDGTDDNSLDDECMSCHQMNHIDVCMEDIADEGDKKGLVCSGWGGGNVWRVVE